MPSLPARNRLWKHQGHVIQHAIQLQGTSWVQKFSSRGVSPPPHCQIFRPHEPDDLVPEAKHPILDNSVFADASGLNARNWPLPESHMTSTGIPCPAWNSSHWQSHFKSVLNPWGRCSLFYPNLNSKFQQSWGVAYIETPTTGLQNARTQNKGRVVNWLQSLLKSSVKISNYWWCLDWKNQRQLSDENRKCRKNRKDPVYSKIRWSCCLKDWHLWLNTRKQTCGVDSVSNQQAESQRSQMSCLCTSCMKETSTSFSATIW